MVNVVTRKPLPSAEYHSQALDLLRANIKPLIFYCNNLHTKLYILQANGFHYAVLGSPNFTAGGNVANIELAIEIRDSGLRRSDNVSKILEELVQYGDDLVKEPQVRLVN
jgi:HKD family nuclease